MDKKQKKVWITVGAAVLGLGGVAALSYAAISTLMNVAMDRTMHEILPKPVIDKGKDKIAGSMDMTEFVQEVEGAAERLKEKENETVEITARDGVRLVGHWIPCKRTRRVIIAMHGWRSSWNKDFGTIADFWNECGCDVLYAEQRAQGESGGDYMGFGMLERYDCRDWVDYVVERTQGKMPIYLGGVSMGATTVLMTAGLDLPGEVKGIMADCGFTSPLAIWRHVMENNLHLSYSLYAPVINELCKRRIQMNNNDYSTLDAMKVCHTPVLFIHGTDDTFVPVTMTYENYKACAAEKRLLIVPGAGHGMSYYTDPESYRKAVLEFFKENDKRPIASPEDPTKSENENPDDSAPAEEE